MTFRTGHMGNTFRRGKLKIGDDWNAITIIALSQTSPLKAIAEPVENSIDVKARTVTITRGREHRRHFLSIRDDGEGEPRDNAGRPDFRYVATHICDSVKRWQSFLRSICCSVRGPLAVFCRRRHSSLHGIESHSATDGGPILGSRRTRALSHSGTPDIRPTVRRGREHRG